MALAVPLYVAHPAFHMQEARARLVGCAAGRNNQLAFACIVPFAQCSHLEFAPPPNLKRRESLISIQQGSRVGVGGEGKGPELPEDLSLVKQV